MYHNKGCNCFECQDNYVQNLQAKYYAPWLRDATGRLNHADIVVKSADEFLDSTLVAKNPVTMYKAPTKGSDIVMEFPKGANVGKIQSWVTRDGSVWWDVNWFSGKHAGWVKHDPGLFNAEIAEATASKVVHDQAVNKAIESANKKTAIESVVDGVSDAVSGAGESLGMLGNNLKWIIIAAVITVIIFGFLKFTSK